MDTSDARERQTHRIRSESEDAEAQKMGQHLCHAFRSKRKEVSVTEESSENKSKSFAPSSGSKVSHPSALEVQAKTEIERAYCRTRLQCKSSCTDRMFGLFQAAVCNMHAEKRAYKRHHIHRRHWLRRRQRIFAHPVNAG